MAEPETQTKRESPDGRWKRSDDEQPKHAGSLAKENVYVAYDTDEGFMVQWNEIPFSQSRGKGHEKKVVQKFKMLKQMRHENIAKFYDYWIHKEGDSKTLVYITELMTSGTLRQYLKRQKKNKKKLHRHVWLRWSRQILSALRYLHDCDPPIAHGDLKSSSIFIQHNGIIKIGAVCVDDIHQNVKTLKPAEFKPDGGGWQYIAPELLAGDATTDQHSAHNIKSDIYSFGLVALEMLTFESPYHDKTKLQTLIEAKQNGELPSSLESVEDPQTKEFIRLCLIPAEHRLTAHELLFHPVMFTVPSLTIQAAHRLVQHREKINVTEEQLEDAENLMELLTGKMRKTKKECSGTKQCECAPLHYRAKASDPWLPNKSIEVEDREKFLDEVRLGFHPLLFVAGQRKKFVVKKKQRPKPTTEVSDKQDSGALHIDPDSIVDVTIAQPNPEKPEEGHIFKIKYRLKHKEGSLLREIDFSSAIANDSGEQFTDMMVHHGLLHMDDRAKVLDALCKAILTMKAATKEAVAPINANGKHPTTNGHIVDSQKPVAKVDATGSESS